mgnify:CR=1 FL=1
MHKRRRKFLLLFDTFLLHVGILTLIYQTSTLNILATSEFQTPSPLKYFYVFYGWPILAVQVLSSVYGTSEVYLLDNALPGRSLCHLNLLNLKNHQFQNHLPQDCFTKTNNWKSALCFHLISNRPSWTVSNTDWLQKFHDFANAYWLAHDFYWWRS